MTRFHEIGEEVSYEIAQITITACRMSEDPRDIKVLYKATASSSAIELPLGLMEYQGAEARSCITETGLVFSTICDEAPSFSDYFSDLRPLIRKVDFTRLPYRRSIRYEGRFNWKTM